MAVTTSQNSHQTVVRDPRLKSALAGARVNPSGRHDCDIRYWKWHEMTWFIRFIIFIMTPKELNTCFKLKVVSNMLQLGTWFSMKAYGSRFGGSRLHLSFFVDVTHWVCDVEARMIGDDQRWRVDPAERKVWRPTWADADEQRWHPNSQACGRGWQAGSAHKRVGINCLWDDHVEPVTAEEKVRLKLVMKT